MSAALKFCIDKYINKFKCCALTDNTSTHAKAVCIVVKSGILCTEIIAATASSDTLYLIGSHRNTNTCATTKNCHIGFTRRHLIASDLSRNGIIKSFGRITTYIDIVNPLFFKMSTNSLFKRKSTVEKPSS